MGKIRNEGSTYFIRFKMFYTHGFETLIAAKQYPKLVGGIVIELQPGSTTQQTESQPLCFGVMEESTH